MKGRVIILLVAAASIQAMAQSDTTHSILTTPFFRYGIYQSFAEFRDNRPSIRSGFEIQVDSSADFLQYRLADRKGRKIKWVYGFSDGERVYLNAQVYNRGAYFVPALVLGNIVYLEDQRARRRTADMAIVNMGIAFGLIGATATAAATSSESRENPGWVVHMPDNDGNIYVLDHVTMKAILQQDDPDLYREYKARPDKNRQSTLLHYLRLFNERHPPR